MRGLAREELPTLLAALRVLVRAADRHAPGRCPPVHLEVARVGPAVDEAEAAAGVVQLEAGVGHVAGR